MIDEVWFFFFIVTSVNFLCNPNFDRFDIKHCSQMEIKIISERKKFSITFFRIRSNFVAFLRFVIREGEEQMTLILSLLLKDWISIFYFDLFLILTYVFHDLKLLYSAANPLILLLISPLFRKPMEQFIENIESSCSRVEKV